MSIFSVSLVPFQYDHAIQSIREELRKMPDERIHANTDDELTDYFYEDWKLEPLEEDPEREITGSEERESRRVENHPRAFGPTTVELQYANISVPLVPKHSNKIVMQLYGQTSLMSSLKHMADFRERDHVVVFRCPLDDVERLLKELRQMIDQVNVDVEKNTPGFRPRVLSEVERRRENVTTQASKFSEVMDKAGVKISRRPGAVEPVDLKVKREIKVLRERQSSGKPEPELSRESLSLILATMDQAGKGFETTPEAFTLLGEERLRDIILGYLNNLYGLGAATGETFSKSGKTDIHLRISEGIVLIAECKFWDGAKLYGETIEQLFRYLTWRHTVGVLVTFSRRKGLTGVIEEAKRATQEHVSFKGNTETLGETHLLSTHVHPSDEQKTINVHHLFFDLAS